jgi:hyperosmotically inducible periplasmic protein
MDRSRLGGAATAVAMALALSACGQPADEVGLQARKEGGKPAAGASDSKPAARDVTAKDPGAGQAAQATRAMGAAAAKVDDATITAKVNAALAADKEASALRVDVDTQNGVVTLSGPAPTASAKEHVAEVARTVRGVQSVNNQLTLQSG